MKTKKISRAFAWLGALAALLSPGLASAAPQLFEVSCSDKSMSDYLVPIFGSLFSQCGGSGGPLEQAIGIFNAGALTLGGLLAAYTLVAGTMQTAHDGEVLGRQWSSLWLPIRTILGVGLVVPVSGGYCVAQLLVGFLISQSVGLADNVWNTYLAAYTTPQGLAPKSRLPNVTALALSILQSEVCMSAYNELMKDATAISNGDMAATAMGPGARVYGLNGGSECGGVNYQKMEVGGGSVTGATSFSPAALSSLEQAHIAALGAMESKLAGTAQKVVAFTKSGGSAPDVAGDMQAAILAYQASVAASASSVFGNDEAMSTVLEAAKSDGWALAGTLFLKAVQLQDAVSQAVAHTPTAVRAQGTLGGVAADMAPYFATLDQLQRRGVFTQTTSEATANAAAQLGNTGDPLAQGAQKVMNWIFGGDWIAKVVQADTDRNALMSVKDFGDYLMTGAEAGLAGGVLMTAGAEAVRAENGSVLGQLANVVSVGTATAAAGAASGAMSTVGWLLVAFCSTLLVFAAGIAVYLPFAPFLLFFGAFVGWLLLCAEAIIAAPLWGVMHLLPGGDGISGGARQGYMLLVGVVMRPALIVLGFIVSLSLLNIVVQGFNGIFFPAFKMAMAGSVVGLGTSFAMVAIYFASMVFLFHFCFSAVSVIPDKILRWIGGGREQLGEAASGLSKTGGAGADSASRHVGDSAGKALQGMTASAARQRQAPTRGAPGEASPAADAKANAMQEKAEKPAQASEPSKAPPSEPPKT
ncbi:DotA/TraY family protein [Duganella sp. PWIR1]